MKDPTAQLRTATKRAKSDVANKLISMFLHELSRKVSRDWPFKVDSEEYASLVRDAFDNRCPYCSCDLTLTPSIVEHLDGMNRLRVGLHVPGNVLIACKRCNGEKRRDDARVTHTLAETGWESFLSHNKSECAETCGSCVYWRSVWPDPNDRDANLSRNLAAIRSFRDKFGYFQEARQKMSSQLPSVLASLYIDCQTFAETEIGLLINRILERS